MEKLQDYYNEHHKHIFRTISSCSPYDISFSDSSAQKRYVCNHVRKSVTPVFSANYYTGPASLIFCH